MKRLAMLSLCFVLAFGCVPTPEEKTDIPEAEKGNAEALLETVPEVFEREKTLDDGIRLIVSAEVIKPDAPLSAGTVKRTPFTAETVRQIGEIMWKDAPMYEFYEPKKEIAEYIVTCKAQLDAAKDALSESEIQDVETTLQEMEKALPNMPDEGKPASYEKLFTYDNGIALVDTGKPRMATLQARADSRNIVSFDDPGFKKLLIEEIEPLHISDSDAVKMAEEILDRLGLEGQFSVVQTGVHTVNYTMVDSLLEDKGYPFEQRSKRRYVVFMRRIGGAKQVYSDQIRWGATDGGFDDKVFWEVMEFWFDNDGPVGFYWQEPGEVTVTQSDVPVIGLDAAYDAMLSYMRTSQNRYTYESYDMMPERITLRIDRIELGMSCILGKNRTIETVPVWEFFGSIEYRDREGKTRYFDPIKKQLTDAGSTANSLCTINAQNGDRIDRGLGY